MAYTLIATGTADDITNLGDYQSQFEEGSNGLLQIDLRSKVAADIIGQLDDLLEKAGIPEKKLEVSGSSLFIHFKTEIAPLVLIAAAIAAVIFIVGLIVAWKLWKLTPEVIVGLSLFAILAIVFAVVAVIVLVVQAGGRLAAGPVRIAGK